MVKVRKPKNIKAYWPYTGPHVMLYAPYNLCIVFQCELNKYCVISVTPVEINELIQSSIKFQRVTPLFTVIIENMRI